MAADAQNSRRECEDGASLLGLLIAQSLGAFNDNAWKQVVVLLAIAAALQRGGAHGSAASAQVVLMVPLMLVSLPAGVLADRVSKRSVIVAMKWLELSLMLAGSAALLYHPSGGPAAMVVLGLLGVQAALFSPAKYGILPENPAARAALVGQRAAGNVHQPGDYRRDVGGGVIVFLTQGQIWLGGLVLAALSAAGLAASMAIPRVPAARTEGGLGTTLRIGWEAIRGDRILGLAVRGQVLRLDGRQPRTGRPCCPTPRKFSDSTSGRWTSRWPPWVVGIGLGCVAAGLLSASKVEYGLLPLGALGLSLSTPASPRSARGWRGLLS